MKKIRLQIPKPPGNMHDDSYVEDLIMQMCRDVDFWAHRQAYESCLRRDAVGVLCCMDNTMALPFVVDHWWTFWEMLVLEKAVVHAFSMTRTNHHAYNQQDIRELLDSCSRRLLKRAGDRLPKGRVHTVYRGVSGRGRPRNVCGLSWTADMNLACWLAARYGLPNPTVYEARVSRRDIYFCDNGRNEQEFVCWPRSYKRLKMSQAEILDRAAAMQHKKETETAEELAQAGK